MEIFRRAFNPWNQEVLIGISWNLMWLAIIFSGLFVVGHIVWARIRGSGDGEPAVSGDTTGLPEKILRHAFSSRVFHWAMTVWMFVLLITAFLPVIGVKFGWVTIHWIAGVLLTLTILYHMVQATFFQDFRSMIVNREDVEAGKAELKRALGKEVVEPEKAGKYPVDHKVYHHAASIVTLVAIVTGILMMFRVDTWFWARNPYMLSDQLWGVVYVLHGLSGVGLIGLVTAHVYFAIRPEKRWITWSMVHGFITREKFAENHDPKRWVIK